MPNPNQSASTIVNTLFAANQRAIYAHDTPNFFFQEFKGNRFRTIRSPVTGIPQTISTSFPLPPFNFNQPTYGIECVRVEGSIGTSGTQNTFDFLSTAIKIESSTMDVKNCRFTNNKVQDWNGIETGIGIWAESSDLTIKDKYSNAASCEFIDNNRGLRSANMTRLHLEDAFFSDQDVIDIEALANGMADVKILNNTINVSEPLNGSILAIRPTGAFGQIPLHIRNNFITMPRGQSAVSRNMTLIDVRSNAGINPVSGIIIDANNITCNYGDLGGVATSLHGIFLTGDNYGAFVSGNIINYSVNSNATPAANGNGINSVGIGMRSSGNPAPFFSARNVIGPGNVLRSTNFSGTLPVANCNTAGSGATRCSWLKCGIHLDAALNTLVCTNDADAAFNNFHFSGNCVGGEFGRNIIGTACVGSNFCTGGGGLGTFGGCLGITLYDDQDYRKNEWHALGMYSTTFASNFPNNFWGQLNNWLVDPNCPFENPNPQATVSMYNTTQPNMCTSQSVCDGILPPPPLFQEPPIEDHFQRRQALQFPFSANLWDFDRFIMGELLSHPNASIKNVELLNFISENSNSTLQKIAQVEVLIANAGIIGSDLQDEISQLLQLLEQKANAVSNIDRLASGDGLSLSEMQQKSVLLNEMRAIRSQIATKQIDLEALTTVFYVEQVKPLIQQIEPQQKIETDYKDYLTLLVKKALKEPFDATDLQRLREIAYQCRLSEGEVVQGARLLLPNEEFWAISVEGDDDFCGTVPRSITMEEKLGFSIAPNPTSDQLEIRFENSFTGMILVEDLAGRTIFFQDKIAEESAFTLSTHYWPSGVYSIKCLSDAGSLNVKKAIIIH